MKLTNKNKKIVSAIFSISLMILATSTFSYWSKSPKVENPESKVIVDIGEGLSSSITASLSREELNPQVPLGLSKDSRTKMSVDTKYSISASSEGEVNKGDKLYVSKIEIVTPRIEKTENNSRIMKESFKFDDLVDMAQDQINKEMVREQEEFINAIKTLNDSGITVDGEPSTFSVKSFNLSDVDSYADKLSLKSKDVINNSTEVSSLDDATKVAATSYAYKQYPNRITELMKTFKIQRLNNEIRIELTKEKPSDIRIEKTFKNLTIIGEGGGWYG